MRVQGLLVSALYSIYPSLEEGTVTDCTNGGVTSKHTRFVLVDGEAIGPFAGSADTPLLRVVRRKGLAKDGGDYLHAEPVFADGTPKPWTMMGGNYVVTSDSRFPNSYPISVHDRIEGPDAGRYLVNERGELELP